MLKTKPFEKHASEYDTWFDKYPYVFESEVAALRAALPYGDLQGIEVGLGTGRFSNALGIKEGVEPAASMREMALARGVDVFDAAAEHLPYKDLRFDFVLMASCINYFNQLNPAFREANRVLKPGGTLIVGCIDKDSIIGKLYESKRPESIFYKQAIFYPVEKVAKEIHKEGFNKIEYTQTLFENLDSIKEFEPAKPGYGEGSFVVIKAIKK
jgi:ubiquinone/menaquinone biosynthesis C-methylase UbiE